MTRRDLYLVPSALAASVVLMGPWVLVPRPDYDWCSYDGGGWIGAIVMWLGKCWS